MEITDNIDLSWMIQQEARRNPAFFALYQNPEYDLPWFQNLVYDYLDKWVKKEIKKLAIFMPPQHGKSSMSSIITPAFILGKNPKAKIVCASYNGSVSSRFNREVQDIMTGNRYKELFPLSRIPEAGQDKDNELRNAQYFETVGQKGFYKAVGVGGSLTGTTIEYGIIDDPIKDRKEANSKTYRENLYNWYTDVWSTRLNNESCELLLFTRWHEDDLAGRLFDPSNIDYDPERAAKWTVIVLPALKEDVKAIDNQIEVKDPRKEGEALWPDMHSVESHLSDKKTNPYTFASLKQQRPAPLEGGLLKREWFQIIKETELPYNPDEVPMHFFIDGAFTEKTTNDPSAILACQEHRGKLYIWNVQSVRYTLNKYLGFSSAWMRENRYGMGSNVRVEYKASGPGIASMLREPEHGGFNVSRINDRHVSFGKMTRGEYITPAMASMKVFLIQGPWNESFIKQCSTFPNDVHDDEFDCLCYAILQLISSAGSRKRRKSTMKKVQTNERRKR